MEKKSGELKSEQVKATLFLVLFFAALGLVVLLTSGK
jgi:hypothetical protein